MVSNSVAASPPWYRSVLERHQAAVRELTAQGQDDEAPRFWELSIELDDRLMNEAARSIAGMIRDRARKHALPACVVLLESMKREMTNVRGNRLWPEVASHLEGRAGSTVDTGRCANWFRDALLSEFESRLPRAGNRYVAFALDEAGVGKDRSLIVSRFLRDLVATTAITAERSGTAVHRYFDRFVQDNPQYTEVEFLKPALIRSGVVLHSLVRDHMGGHGAGAWLLGSWDDLRSYWLARASFDLRRLLPEAQAILTELLEPIGKLVTRAGLARLMLAGEPSVRFPEVLEPPQPGCPVSALPITPVQLTADGLSRTVLVCDENQLTAGRLLHAAPGEWHVAAGGMLYCWSRDPFEVQTSPTTSETSVPMISGEDILHSQIDGHYWSGARHAMGYPRSAAVRETAPPIADLELSYRWVASSDGLNCVVDSFSGPAGFGGVARLLVDGAERWVGTVVSGGPSNFLSVEFARPATPAPAGAFEASLQDASCSSIATAFIEDPANGQLVVAIRGAVQPAATSYLVSAQELESPDGILVMTRVEPQIDGADLVSAPVARPVDGMAVYRIKKWEGPVHAITLNVAGCAISILVGEVVSIRCSASGGAPLEQARLTGSDDLTIAGMADPLPATIRGWRSAALRGAPFPENVIEIEAGGDIARAPFSSIAELVEVEEPDGAGHLSLVQLLKHAGMADRCGLVSIGLGGPLVDGPRTHRILRVGADVAIPVCGVGDRSKAVLRGDDGSKIMSFESDQDVSVGAVAGNETARGRIELAGGETVDAEWHPRVCDALAIYDGQTLEAGTAPDDPGRNLEILLFDTDGGSWTMGCAPGEFGHLGRVAFSWLVAKGAVRMVESAIVIEALHDSGLRKEWSFEQTPADLMMTFAWSGLDTGGLRLECSATWRGLDEQELRFELCRGGEAVRSFRGTTKESGYELIHRACSFDFAFAGGPPSALHDMSVTVWSGSALIRSFQVPDAPPHARETTLDGLCTELKQLLEECPNEFPGDDAILTDVLSLTEMYIRRVSRLPFELDGMLNRIAASPSSVSRLDVALGIRLLDELTSDLPPRGVAHWPSSRSGSRLQLLVLTLLAVREDRMVQYGEAAPERFVRLAAELGRSAGAAETPFLCAWARCMAAFCDRQTPSLVAPDPGVVEEPDLEMVRREQLVDFYPPLKRWLGLESAHGEG